MITVHRPAPGVLQKSSFNAVFVFFPLFIPVLHCLCSAPLDPSLCAFLPGRKGANHRRSGHVPPSLLKESMCLTRSEKCEADSKNGSLSDLTPTTRHCLTVITAIKVAADTPSLASSQRHLDTSEDSQRRVIIYHRGGCKTWVHLEHHMHRDGTVLGCF